MGKYSKGTTHKTNQGYEIRVIKDISPTRKVVKFLDEHGYMTETPTSSIARGSIKNPFHPSLLGRGFVGVGIYNSKDREYQLWKTVLNNVYNVKSKKVKLCKEWHNFQTFAKDINELYGFDLKDKEGRFYNLSKDIMPSKKKIYSKKTCVFIPPEINAFLNHNKQKEGGLPTGVKYRHQDRRYETKINICGRSKYISSGLTIELMRQLYINARNKRARELAEVYKGKVDIRVIDFLLNYNETNQSK